MIAINPNAIMFTGTALRKGKHWQALIKAARLSSDPGGTGKRMVIMSQRYRFAPSSSTLGNDTLIAIRNLQAGKKHISNKTYYGQPHYVSSTIFNDFVIYTPSEFSKGF